jgi:hypothetical protein
VAEPLIVAVSAGAGELTGVAVIVDEVITRGFARGVVHETWN